jgi:hypothetical protein
MANQFVHLQYIGEVPAIEASEIEVGDVRMYNHGSTSTVIKVIEKTAKTLTIITVDDDNGKYFMSDIRKSTLVAIVRKNQDVSMHNPKEAYNISGRNKGMVDVSKYFETEEEQEETDMQTKNNLTGRKVFGQWGIGAGWEYGIITNVEADSVGTDIIIKWEDDERLERKDLNNLVVVDDYTNMEKVGLYLLPIEEENKNEDNADELEVIESKQEENKQISVKQITFKWSEASHIIKDNTVVNTLTDANMLIFKVASDMSRHNEQGYRKTSFVIEWEDGQTHTGRIDVQSNDYLKFNPIGDHVRGFYKMLACITKPSGHTWEEHKNNLKAIYKIGKEEMKEIKEMLNTYQFDNETKETEPAPENNTIVVKNEEVKEVCSNGNNVVSEQIKVPETQKEQPKQEDNTNSQEAIETTVSSSNKSLEVTYQLNEEKNGVELFFSEKPNAETRNMMKAHGFRWGGRKQSSKWWAVQSDETIALAKQVAGVTDQEETENNYNNQISEKQQETLKARLQKDNVKPLRLFKHNRNDSVLLECVNLNLSEDDQKPFYFLIQVEGNEISKGYDYKEFLSEYEEIHSFESPKSNITGSTSESWTPPEIEIEDCYDSKYNIPQDIQDREHESSWITRREKKDHNKDIQETFLHYNSEVKELLSTLDNSYYEYKIKEALQRFKKKYHELLVKWLTMKGNNPSWVVTGRGNLNVSRYNKKMDRINNVMLDLAGLPEEFKKKLNYYKNKAYKEKKQKLREEVNKTDITIEFKAHRKDFEYMGIKDNRRVYSYNDYWIVKTFGCFRIFKGNKEIYSMKTTDKLEDAKKYVSYLVNIENQKVS